MTEGFLVTVSSGLGYRTYTDMSKASRYVELLILLEENSVITIRHGDDIEERAVVHGITRSDLATERVEVGVVEDYGVAPVLICRMLRIETPLDEDLICTNCEGEDWTTAILDGGTIVHRLRTCRVCGYQFTTGELPEIDADFSDPYRRASDLSRQDTDISDSARELLSVGATDNPDEEMTVSFFTEGNEATAYRIFRRRHIGGEDPMKAADQWIRQAKRLCAAARGELKATAVGTDLDGGSVLVTITGNGIVAKGDAGQAV